MTGRHTKVALVGCGARGCSHLDVILALRDRLELVALCDRSRGALAAAGALAGPGVHRTSELADLAGRARPDFAIVALKSDVQPAVCLALLAAGVPVLSEVPPAFAGPAARPMLEAARRGRLAFGAAENYPCTPLEQLKRRAIAAGVFGAVGRAEIHGSISHKGHEIALGRAYLGYQRPLRVRARADGRERRGLEGVPIPVVMSGVVEFEGGSRLELLLSGRGVAGPRIPIVGWRSEFTAERGGYHEGRFHRGRFAEGGAPLALDVRVHDVAGAPTLLELALASEPAVAWRNPFADRAFSADHRLPGMELIEDLPQAWEIALAHLLLDMADAVRDGRPPEYPAERALEDVRIRLAMFESARRGGEWVAWREEPWPIERRLAGFQPHRELRKLRRRLSRLVARHG